MSARTWRLPVQEPRPGLDIPALGPWPDLHGPTLDVLPSHVAVLDRRGVIRLTNQAWNRFASENGLAAPDGGRDLNYLAACDAATGDNASVARAVALGLRQVLAGERETFEHGCYPCHAPGRERWFTLQAHGLVGGGAVVLHHDVTELYLAARLAEQRALHDPLTGLPNRLLLLDRLGQALQRVGRTAGGAGLLMVDLDGFKRVNDRHGHATGDKFLRLVGRRMSATLRRGDTVARWGGDEFVAVLPDLARIGEGATLGARLLLTCQRSAPVGGTILRPSLSVGLAVAPEHGRDPALLLACADSAMYRAKAAGGGRLVLAELGECTKEAGQRRTA